MESGNIAVMTVKKYLIHFKLPGSIGQAHHMFTRFLNLRKKFHEIFLVLFFNNVEVFY